MKRHLTLKSEYLAPLTTNELSMVAGAAATTQCFTGIYPSINRPCPTLDECIAIGEIPTTNCFTGTSAHTVLC